MARDMMTTKGVPTNLKLHFIATRTKNARQYNVLMADEDATLMVRDGFEAVNKHNIVVTQQADPFRCISELHVRYMALHYPLLFF